MDTNAPHFSVGYGNGYGYPVASAASVEAPTQAMNMSAEARNPSPGLGTFQYELPVTGPVPAVTPHAAPTPSPHGVDPRYAPTMAVPAVVMAADMAMARTAGPSGPPRGRGNTAGLAIGAVAILIIIASIAAIIMTTSSSALAPTSASSSRSKAVTTGTQLDEHGNVIGALVDADTGPRTDSTVVATTEAPTRVAPTTAPPTTQAPTTLPPTTLAPTTLPPPTVPPSTTPPPTLGPPPVMPTATINSFTTPASVNCTNPLQQFFSLPMSWSTTGAVKVTISIDGPGIYQSYPGSNGSDTFPFSCGGPHTYLLTAYTAANVATTRTIVIQHS